MVLTNHRRITYHSFSRIRQTILNISFISRLSRGIVHLHSRKRCLYRQNTCFLVICPDLKVQPTCLFNLDEIVILQYFCDLLLRFKILTHKVMVVIRIRDIWLSGIAFTKTKLNITCSCDRKREVQIFFRYQSKGKISVKR